jgi:nicotinamidase-related amidase
MSDLSLNPQKTALIAIDLQNALMELSAAPIPVADVVKTNRQIAEALRARGGLVVWARVDGTNS